MNTISDGAGPKGMRHQLDFLSIYSHFPNRGWNYLSFPQHLVPPPFYYRPISDFFENIGTFVPVTMILGFKSSANSK